MAFKAVHKWCECVFCDEIPFLDHALWHSIHRISRTHYECIKTSAWNNLAIGLCVKWVFDAVFFFVAAAAAVGWSESFKFSFVLYIRISKWIEIDEHHNFFVCFPNLSKDPNMRFWWLGRAASSGRHSGKQSFFFLLLIKFWAVIVLLRKQF